MLNVRVACSVALKAIELYEEKGFARGKGESEYFQKKLHELTDHSIVGEVRTIGFLGAIELVKEKGSKACWIHMPRILF